jgi:hypothetical protein
VRLRGPVAEEGGNWSAGAWTHLDWREAHVGAAKALVSGGFMPFADWARVHMKP